MTFKNLSEARIVINELLYTVSTAELQNLSDTIFYMGWQAVFFAAPGLHPDDFDESDTATAFDATAHPLFADTANPYFTVSGFPVAFAPIIREGWRRYDNGRMTDVEFYCAEAAAEGIACAG